MKYCSGCKQNKSIGEFGKDSRRKDRLTFRCKSCLYAYVRHRRSINPEAQRNYHRNYQERNKERLRRQRYERFKRNPLPNRLAQKRWREKHREANSFKARAKRHGMTVERIKAMLEYQNHACAICKKKFQQEPHDARHHVDHCHKYNYVRDLLCGRCNKGIGIFNDDPDLLERAASYVGFHEMCIERLIDMAQQ